jgi:hypothetical protein
MEFTCGNCDKLMLSKNERYNHPGCQATDDVVPHEYDGEKLIFWRVPTHCPRSDNDVKKSEKRAPKKHWVIRNPADIIRGDV